MSNRSAIEEKIQYAFRDRKHLDEALTHSSARSDGQHAGYRDNERLEFLGDAYLDAIVGSMLYEALPGAPEGELTRRRAEIVCERNLAALSRRLGIGRSLNLGKGEEHQGGREKDSILADAMEALIGAILTDGGFSEAERFVRREFAPSVNDSLNGLLFSDYKSEFQEKLHCMDTALRPEYSVARESGPDHDKTFLVHLKVNGRILGEGTGKSKKEAEQEAARDALRKGLINVF